MCKLWLFKFWSCVCSGLESGSCAGMTISGPLSLDSGAETDVHTDTEDNYPWEPISIHILAELLFNN